MASSISSIDKSWPANNWPVNVAMLMLGSLPALPRFATAPPLDSTLGTGRIRNIGINLSMVIRRLTERNCVGNTLNLSLTDELRAFIEGNCGDGTLYATPSEFVRDLLRQKKLQLEAEAAREAILAGYSDAIAGHTVPYKGNLRAAMKQRKQ
jgi:antitoxin ParD1/3/4